jgi:hypothetical protein
VLETRSGRDIPAQHGVKTHPHPRRAARLHDHRRRDPRSRLSVSFEAFEMKVNGRRDRRANPATY